MCAIVTQLNYNQNIEYHQRLKKKKQPTLNKIFYRYLEYETEK